MLVVSANSDIEDTVLDYCCRLVTANSIVDIVREREGCMYIIRSEKYVEHKCRVQVAKMKLRRSSKSKGSNKSKCDSSDR